MLLSALLTLPLLTSNTTAAEDLGRLVVLNKAAHTANVIDVASGKTLATLKTGQGPHEVAVHPGGRFAVVADYGERTPGSSLTVIDLRDLEVVRKIDLGEGVRPHGLRFEAGGKYLWITAETVQQAWRIQFASGRIDQKVTTGAQATHMIALGRRGLVFTANIGSGSMSVLQRSLRDNGLPQWKLAAEIKTGAGAEGICVSADGRQVWVTNRQADTVSVYDVEKAEIVAELPCPGFPIRAEASADGRLVVVSCATAAEVALFDAIDLKPLARIPMKLGEVQGGDAVLGSFGDSATPIGIALHPNGKTAYVANAAVDQVAILDLVRRKVVGSVKTGRGPDGIAWIPSTVVVNR